eukprot:11220942-Lingulodinium_polyedra.AAC.1
MMPVKLSAILDVRPAKFAVELPAGGNGSPPVARFSLACPVNSLPPFSHANVKCAVFATSSKFGGKYEERRLTVGREV